MIETPFTMVKMNFDKDETGKHGAFTNVFSCWNGMVGPGLVTNPRAYSKAGVVLVYKHSPVAFVISFTTQYFIMKTAGEDRDYTNTLRKTFGKRGFYFGMCAFILMLTIPIILFFQLLAQFLFPILLVIIEVFTG